MIKNSRLNIIKENANDFFGCCHHLMNMPLINNYPAYKIHLQIQIHIKEFCV